MLADVFGAVAAVGLLGGLAATAWIAGGLVVGRRGGLLRWLACALALAWLATAIFHGLAALRLFAVGPALVAVAAILALAVRLAGGPAGLDRLRRADAVFARRVGRRIRDDRRGVFFALLAALAAPTVLRAAILPPLGWDTLSYRGVKAAMWVQNAGVDTMVGTGPWGYYRNMLAGGEVFLAWAMLPVRADTLTGLGDVLQWVTLGLAVLALARELGARGPFASACAAFVVSIPTVAVLPGSGYVELAQQATLVGGIAVGLRGLRGRPALLALSGAALGVSASTKFPMIPLCGVVFLLIGALAWRRGPGAARAASGLGAVLFAVALAPWLALSWWRTGAIFSPLPIAVGPFVLGHGAPELLWMMSRPIPALPRPALELEVLVRVFHPPLLRSEALGVAALVPLAAAPFGFVRLARRNATAASVVGCAMLISAALYFSPGLLPVRVYWPLSSSRFLLPVVTLAAVAAVAATARRPAIGRGSPFAAILLALAILQLGAYVGYGFSGASALGAAIAGAGIVAATAVATLAARGRAPAVRLAAVALVGAVAIVGLSALRDHLRDRLFESDFTIHRDEKPWAAAIPPIDTPATPRTIAVTSGPKRSMDNSFAYPFLGRRFQNRVVYVPVTADGAILPLGDRAAMEALAAAADFEAWSRRLEEGGVTEVMSFAPASLELGWMERRPDRFEKISGVAGEWGLYRLRRGERPADSPRGTPGS